MGERQRGKRGKKPGAKPAERSKPAPPAPLLVPDQDTTSTLHGMSDRSDTAPPSPAAGEADAADTANQEAPARPEMPNRSVDAAPSRTPSVSSLSTSVHDTPHSSDTDDDDDEPMYSFTSMGWSAKDIFAKDSLSAMAVSKQSVAIGMHSGMLYILNHEGLLQKGFQFHSAAVHHLVFDTSGTFVGSAGMDGVVAIASLHTSEQYTFDFKRPVQTLSLDPHFAQRSSRAFVCGGMGGALVHREKSWFGYKETILASGEGPIWAVEWHGRWIAWANDRGVRILDATTHEVITLIAAPDIGIRKELARCSLVWRDDTTLMIAQGQRLTVAHIRLRDAPAAEVLQSVSGLVPGLSSTQGTSHVEIGDIFQLDCLISGVVMDEGQIVTMAYVAHPDDLQMLYDEQASTRMTHPASLPELRVITTDGEEVGSDVLDMRQTQRLHCNDYHLCTTKEDRFDPVRNARVPSNVMYMASPSQIMIARPWTQREHVDWLVARHAYKEALATLNKIGGDDAKALGYDVVALGQTYLLHLIDEHNAYEEAATLLPTLLQDDKSAWEEMVLLFVERNQLPLVLDAIPTGSPLLSDVVYDMVLVHLLHTNEKLLLDTLQRWPAHIYTRQAVVAAIRDRPQRSPTLLACLAELYLAGRQPGKALEYLLQLRDPTVFALIREQNLYTDIQDQLAKLIELEQDLAGTPRPASSHMVQMLVDHIHSVPIHRVMPQLASFPWYRYLYLDALFDRDPQLITDYANELVALYAEDQYAKLMPFLRTMSSVYSYEKAYEVCEKHDYVPEMVFLLGRIGDVTGALNLIIERLHDVQMAVDFVKQQDDDELWDRLLLYSQDRPEFIRGLLEHVGGEIDPVRIIRQIRKGLTIPGLKPAVIKILHTIHLQHSLMEGCNAVLQHAVREQTAQHKEAVSSGRYCDQNTQCVVCSQPMLRHGEAIQMYLCRHSAHLACVAAGKQGVPIEPFVLPTETTSSLYAKEARAWLQQDPSSDALPSTPQPVVAMTKEAEARFHAQTTFLLRGKRIAARWLQQKECPVCAERRAHCLAG